MFLQKHVGREVQVRTLAGEVISGELTDVTDTDAYIARPGGGDPQKVPFNTISTSKVIGDYGTENE